MSPAEPSSNSIKATFVRQEIFPLSSNIVMRSSWLVSDPSQKAIALTDTVVYI